MRPAVLIDTGPLVAILNANDRYHSWSVEQLKKIQGPLLTCEPVLSEAFFLMRTTGNGVEKLWDMLNRQGIKIHFSLAEEMEIIAKLMVKYADQPMSLADACLVRMSELCPGHQVFTLDSDFKLYRRGRNRSIPTISPAD